MRARLVMSIDWHLIRSSAPFVKLIQVGCHKIDIKIFRKPSHIVAELQRCHFWGAIKWRYTQSTLSI